MLQKDNLFRRREETNFRPIAPAPAVAAAIAERGVSVTPPANTEPARQASALTSPPAVPKTTEGTKPGEGSKLIVGPDVKLKGVEITDCDTLVVEGRVESALDSRVIQISEHGVFNGAASIDIAEIHGRFDGELTARKQLVIHASGRVSGKIRYGNIKIEEGGEITGDVGSLRASNPAKT
jgi:cytoskeletal protein CcmA (bactofilin family)